MSSRSTTSTKSGTTLALIPYLNCEPFYGSLSALPFDVVREVPRELGRLAASGVPTCGPMAVADAIRLRDTYEPLGDFGIACEGPAHSVLLFTKREITEMAGAHVAVTEESSTSARLVRLILEDRYGLDGLTYERGNPRGASARLVIGDEALRAAAEGLDDFPFVYDLGEEWLGWQALPFVFARWMVARSVPAADRAVIEAAIAASLDTWEDRLDDITARRGEDVDLDRDGIHRYLSTFRYRIGPVEEMGERTFEGHLKERK
ncbi:menaquinone biosynthesis protein [bacterium]|nr:menaquinone biosynthesis protein [bacterium]